MKTVQAAIQEVNDSLQKDNTLSVVPIIKKAMMTPALEANAISIVVKSGYGITEPIKLFLTTEPTHPLHSPIFLDILQPILVLTPKKKRTTTAARTGYIYRVGSVDFNASSIISESTDLDTLPNLFFSPVAHEVNRYVCDIAASLQAYADLQQMGITGARAHDIDQALKKVNALIRPHYEAETFYPEGDDEVMEALRRTALNIQMFYESNGAPCNEKLTEAIRSGQPPTENNQSDRIYTCPMCQHRWKEFNSTFGGKFCPECGGTLKKQVR